YHLDVVDGEHSESGAGNRKRETVTEWPLPVSRLPVPVRSETQPVLPPLNSHLLHDRDPPVAHGNNAGGRGGPVVVPSQRDHRRQAIRIPVLQRLDGRPD